MQALLALRNMHHQNLVHGQISSKTLFLMLDGTLRIQNSSLAKFEKEEGMTETEEKFYKSPELLDNHKL